MRRIYSLVLSCLLTLSLQGQQLPVPDVTIPLWPDGAPTSNGFTEPETDFKDHFHHTTQPELWLYLPERPNGVAVMACPGGGYEDVWYAHEGAAMADWYNEQGFTYAVLKYRIPNGHKEVPLDDVHEAMRILKSHRSEWGIQQLGIQGCSAGGHLAAMASTHYTCPEERPDFTILFYPVITLDPSYTHLGTLHGLLGAKPSKKFIAEYSNEQQVTADTPPAFIIASTNDDLVPVRNSIEYYTALQQHGVEATMHLYPEGGHGWCWRDWFRWKPNYCSALSEWLKGFVAPHRVLWIGDSITDGGWGNSGGSMAASEARNHGDMNHIYGHSYMMLCASQLQSAHPSEQIQCWNRGISGNTLQQMAERWSADALALRPNVISILVGTNDVHYYLDEKAAGKTSKPFDVQAWEEHYHQLIRMTQDSLPGVRLILCTPFVGKAGWVGQAENFPERQALVEALAASVRRIAQDTHATLVSFDSLFANLSASDPSPDHNYWIWDGIHPTPAGHRQMADLWLKEVFGEN